MLAPDLSRFQDLDGRLRDHEGPSYPKDAISAISFMPATRLLLLSYKNGIKHADTYKLRNSDSPEYCYAKFEPHWREEVEKSRRDPSRGKPSLIVALLKTFWTQILLFMIMFLTWAGLQYATPLLIPHITDYLLYRTLPSWWGYVYAVAIFVATLCGTILWNVSLYYSCRIGARARSALVLMLYKKTLSVAPSSLGSRGKVINLMSTDANYIIDTLPSFLMGVSAPFQLIATLGLIAHQIGIFCLIPIAVLFLALPLVFGAGKILPGIQMKVQRAADMRVKLTTEFIASIRIVKYYAWERPFAKNIILSREREIKQLRKVATINAVLLASLVSLPALAMGWTIFFYAIKHEFTLGKIFSAIAFLSQLRYPFILLPLTFTFGSQYLVFFARLRDFCILPEIHNGEENQGEIEKDENADSGMSISNSADFSWSIAKDIIENNNSEHLTPKVEDEGQNIGKTEKKKVEISGSGELVEASTTRIALKDMDIQINAGQLVIVVGGVGAGKSSLASAFLGELTVINDGIVNVRSSIGYASQEPFIINTTIRDNITFGRQYEPIWYQKVINACALVTDFSLFQAGDLTEVAEKGSNLSGGQRQRINVARAMYSNRKNFLFDDPFSAVDAHVADHMFKNVCLPLRADNRAVLLITNQLQFLPFADRVVVLENGTIAEQGTYDELLERKSAMYMLAIEYGLIQDEKMKSQMALSGSMKLPKNNRGHLKYSSEMIKLENEGEDIESMADGKKRKRPKAMSQLSSHLGETLVDSGRIEDGSFEEEEDDINLRTEELTAEEIELRDEKNRKLGALIGQESLRKKAVGNAVFAFYFAAGSISLWVMVVIFNLIRTAFSVGQSVWLSRWANPEHVNQFDKRTYMGAYIALVFGEVLGICGFAFLMVLFTTNASRRIHHSLFTSIAHASTSFFDTTPLGRLLSRFSKDMQLIDFLLPLQLQNSTNAAFLVLGILVNLAIASKYAIIVTFVAIAYFVALLVAFRRTSVQLQRLEAMSRAPIFTHFAETLDGLPTIRAFGMKRNFTVATINKVNINTTDYLTMRFGTQWFNVAANTVVDVIVAGIIVMFMLFRNYTPESYNVSLAVSAVANSVNLITLLSSFSYLFAEYEAKMNAPERVLEYKDVEQERAYIIEGQETLKSENGHETVKSNETGVKNNENGDENSDATVFNENWPSHGEIVFEDLTIAYKPGVPVLHALSATINPREKVGIVGRTGAGKSTLITALFRTTEPASGRVLVDGVDIDRLGLFDLRRKLSIIPQVPQLFTGTIRYNLDPFGAHNDADLWRVLDMVSLKQHVASLDGGIDSMVEENGENFSVGQRQLLSMSRCLLIDSKILLLDEATASLDVQSDAMIQRMIRTHFANRTVLTIAHRLITIMDSDRVLVLDAGRIVEFDSPKNLLLKEGGAFHAMVQKTGKETAAHLTAIANGLLRVADVLEEDPNILEDSLIEEDVVKPEKKRRKKKSKKQKGAES